MDAVQIVSVYLEPHAGGVLRLFDEVEITGLSEQIERGADEPLLIAVGLAESLRIEFLERLVAFADFESVIVTDAFVEILDVVASRESLSL